MRLTSHYCCSLSPGTKIGEGVFFPHNFPLVINPAAQIGKCCVIHPGVLVGTTRGKDGAPVIGDFCFLGDGCKIVGNCKIGDYVFIAPNAVVTKDIPSCSVVGSGVNIILNQNGKEEVRKYHPIFYANE